MVFLLKGESDDVSDTCVHVIRRISNGSIWASDGYIDNGRADNRWNGNKRKAN